MSIRTGFFDAIDGEPAYSAEEFNNVYKDMVTDGIFTSAEGDDKAYFKVLPLSGMSVTVNAGRAIMAKHWIEMDTEVALTLDIASPTLSRFDAIILQLDIGTESRSAQVYVKKGEGSVKPTATNSGNIFEYILAYVSVTAGLETITTSNIQDQRGTENAPWVMSEVKATILSNGAASTAINDNFGANRVVFTNSSGKLDYKGEPIAKLQTNYAQSATTDINYVTPVALAYLWGISAGNNTKTIRALIDEANSKITSNTNALSDKAGLSNSPVFNSPVKMKSGLHYYNSTFGLDMNNSDIVGMSGVYTNDSAKDSREGINWKRSDNPDGVSPATTTWSSIWADNGVIYFNPRTRNNSTEYANQNNSWTSIHGKMSDTYKILHTGNITEEFINAIGQNGLDLGGQKLSNPKIIVMSNVPINATRGIAWPRSDHSSTYGNESCSVIYAHNNRLIFIPESRVEGSNLVVGDSDAEITAGKANIVIHTGNIADEIKGLIYKSTTGQQYFGHDNARDRVYGLDMSDSDIIGVHAIQVNNSANSVGSISFTRSDGDYDSLWIHNGTIRFGIKTKNTLSSHINYDDSNSHYVIHSGILKDETDSIISKYINKWYISGSVSPDGVTINDKSSTNVGSIKLLKGTYTVTFFVRWSANKSGNRYIGVHTSSGSTSTGTLYAVAYQSYVPAVNGQYTTQHITIPVNVAGDSATLYLNAWQDSGSNIGALGRIHYSGIRKD